MSHINWFGPAIFAGVALVAALIAAWFEAGLLTRRAWGARSRVLTFALLANEAGALGVAALVFAVINVVFLGALSGTRDVAATTIVLVLLLLSPVLIFLLRLGLLRALQIGQPTQAGWRYAAVSAALTWVFDLTALILAIVLLSRTGGSPP